MILFECNSYRFFFCGIFDFKIIKDTLLRAERQFGAPLDEAALAEHFEVRARLAMMAKQFKRAERIWLENNALSEAIDMWRRLGDWESALELARAMV